MDHQSDVITKLDVDIIIPSDFAVIIWNDDVTSMEFVVEVLTKVFNKEPQDAAKLMMDVHMSGFGTAGVYSYDIALSKKSKADAMSQEKGFPLKLTVQELPG